MEFLEGKCPKCAGQLQIPKNLDRLICMYCGKELNINDIIVRDIDIDVSNSIEQMMRESKLINYKEYIKLAEQLYENDKFNYEANYALACDNLPKLLLNNQALMSSFKNKLYEDAFNAFLKESRPVLDYVDRAYLVTTSDKTQLLKVFANHFIKTVKEDVVHNPDLKTKAINTKAINTKALEDYKMILALYVLPMIREAKLDISEELVKYIHEGWVLEFPDYKISIGNYDDIKNGFRSKKFCYITTAVCETLGKADNCYELNLFRRYRDTYLMKDEEGMKLIEEYYIIAPEIVNKINSLENKSEIYKQIWEKYLSKCIILIEEDKKLECRKIYITMVRDLQKMYLVK